jgi:hypothetical protein
MTMFGMRYLRGAGAFAFGQDRWIAAGFDLAGIIALVLIVMGMSWILGRANKPPHSTAVATGG